MDEHDDGPPGFFCRAALLGAVVLVILWMFALVELVKRVW